MDIKFKKLSEKATQPVRTTDSGAGYDLTAAGVTTEVNERGQLILVYHTDLSVEIPEGYEAYLRPSNTISSKTLRMCDAPAVIKGGLDNDIVVRFITTTDVVPAVYKEGDTIAQVVFNKIEDVNFVEFIDATEESAATGSQSSPEDKGEPTNSETAPEASGEAQSSLEQA